MTLRMIAFGAVLLALSCSTKQVGVTPPSNLWSRGANLELNVEGEGVDPEVLLDLTRYLKVKLMAAGFDLDPGSANAVRLRVTVHSYSPGSAAMRLIVGFGAGRGSLVYTAQLVTADGRLLGEMEGKERFTGLEPSFSQEYGSTTGFGGAETVHDVLVWEAGKHIAEFVGVPRYDRSREVHVRAQRTLPFVDEMAERPAGALGSVPPGNLEAFYAGAAEGTHWRPDLTLFAKECSAPIEGPTAYFRQGHFHLARSDDGRRALFVVTDQPKVLRERDVSSGGPDGTKDWGFIYDRNADGWVDYVVFLYGPQAVKTEENAHLVPVLDGVTRADITAGASVTMSIEEYEVYAEHVKLVFSHHADDNFDGRSDGIVAPLYDTDNPIWNHGYAVLRSLSFTPEVEESWRFVNDIGTRAGPAPRTDDGFDIWIFTGKDRPLERSTAMLDEINHSIRACRLPNGALPATTK